MAPLFLDDDYLGFVRDVAPIGAAGIGLWGETLALSTSVGLLSAHHFSRIALTANLDRRSAPTHHRKLSAQYVSTLLRPISLPFSS